MNLTLATDFATVLPYERHGKAAQSNWFKFKLTSIQILQGIGQSQARNSGLWRRNGKFVARITLIPSRKGPVPELLQQTRVG
jgi:hypothetical protein